MRKYPTISAVHNRLNYKSKSGLYPVYLRLYFKGKADFILLDKVPPISNQDWIGDASQDLYVVNPKINRIIKEALSSAREWTQDQILSGRPITIKEVKEHLKETKSGETFNEFVERYIRNLNKNKAEDEKLSLNTIKTYKSFLYRLNEFNPNIAFDELTNSLAHRFERYLANDCNQKGVTRSKHFKKFKACYRAASKIGLVRYDEKLMFDDIKIREQKSTRISLTQEELQKFKSATLESDRDEYFKNVFLFACLTGLYYSDIRNLKIRSIENETIIDGEEKRTVKFITGNRSKNGEEFVTPIFPDTLKILEKYSNWPNCEELDSELFPDLISDQKYNAKLKGIAVELGIEKRLTAKVARHTFAELMISWNVPIKKVSRALGHQLASTTEGVYGRQSKANAIRGWIDFEL